MAKKKGTKIRARMFMITQYEYNPRTGEDLNFNEATICRGLDIRGDSLNAWAYIRHDKDVYNQDDDIPEGKEIGDVRPPHWHVMLSFKNVVEIGGIARDFGVSENYIERWQGKGAFLDGIQYLTHEHPRQFQDLGKHKYERSEVRFESEEKANFYWDMLDTRTEKRLYSLPEKDAIDRVLAKLKSGEWDLTDAYKDNESLYAKQETLFKRSRRLYLANKPLPLVRTNYYITGVGGAGKSVAAIAMARSLFPDLPDEKLYYIVGDGRVAFDKYDGQPVIIWDDWRARDLLSKFDRGTVWKIFAVNPEKVTQQVKYGEVVLTNSINIVTAVQSFKDFITDLAGEYVDSNKTKHKAEDPGQGYRRFPVFIEIAKDNVDIFVSGALTDGERSEYERVVRVNASIVELAKNNTEKNRSLVMGPIKKIHKKIEGSNKAPTVDGEDIPVKVMYNGKFSALFDDNDVIDGDFTEK
mgnify:CR=1 FL=1